ncbi:zinc-finger domain-containing protein [Pigmentiphaga kullae]|uniref:Putative Zn-finger protein n=1 Tax=Pigmentiphaga kullae TaxID=151784 RepID=A0A4Q7NNX8_9BURK|nr:zinc-finger domain-containing protein [Pigmentiphaga kullae]RZS86280.1 putative Zn-finger protein [Pigmentiphaga kullae]
MTTEAANAIIEVDADALPLSCPGPQTPLWNMHPKVFLDIGTTGEAKCPYCGAEYRLKGPLPTH